MKISPVVGTPTIQALPDTGNSPQKLARLKAIAAGETPVAPEALGAVDTGQKSTQRKIKMRTNHTINREIAQPVAQEPEPETQTAISDASVQTNAVAEATAPLSPQLAAIAKQRRALQIKEQQIAEREKALSGPTRAELESRIKTQPLSVLQELGVTYDQLTQEILSAQDGTNPKIHELEAKLQAIEESVDKKLSEKDSNAERAVLTDMARNITRLSSEGDDFEMIRATNSQEEVLGRIYDHWLKTGEVFDEAEMMAKVEAELVEEAFNYAKMNKVQKKLTPASLQPQPTQGMRTLTNKDSASPAMDRRQRAMLAAAGLPIKR